jgi:hypothetical protein
MLAMLQLVVTEKGEGRRSAMMATQRTATVALHHA